MADRDYSPDEWSDHDFFLISHPGEQEALRQDLRWLPRHDRISFSFRETEHGLKVLYDDGHLIEFAVFDLEEIALAGVSRYRTLLDRGGVEQRMREVAARPPRESYSDEYLLGMFVTGIQVGLGRTARGERLSGRFFVLWGTRYLCWLVARHVPSDDAGLLDGLDPLRRFERAHPRLGAEIDRALQHDPVALLDLAERELRPLLPALPWDALESVRKRGR